MKELDSPSIQFESQKEYEAEEEKESVDSLENPPSTPNNNNNDNNKLRYESKFTLLLNRFNQEREQISKLRNQSIFILTIVGFLISCCIGVMGANWFELSIIYQIPLGILILLIFGIASLATCIIPSIICLICVSISSDKYYVNYPAQDMYVYLEYLSIMNNDDENKNKEYAEKKKNIEDMYMGSSYDEICSNLEKFTYRNMEKNLHYKHFVKISAFALPVFFVILLSVFIWLVIVNLDATADVICTCEHYVQTLMTKH